LIGLNIPKTIFIINVKNEFPFKIWYFVWFHIWWYLYIIVWKGWNC